MEELIALDPLIQQSPAYGAYKEKLLHLEEENQTIRSYFEKIIDAVPGHLYWKDLQGIYLGCNVFMLDFCQVHSKSDIIGKSDADLWPQDARALQGNDQKVIQTGKTIVFEETVYGVINRSVKRPLRDEDGTIIGIVGNSVDISDLKKIERELRETREVAEAARVLSKNKFSFFEPRKDKQHSLT